MNKSLILSTGVQSRIVENQQYLYGRGAQADMFRLADDDGHRVCVVLEVYGTRHFTSFPDYNAFLARRSIMDSKIDTFHQINFRDLAILAVKKSFSDFFGKNLEVFFSFF